MDIPDYIKTEWKGRGLMIVKVADSECKTCLKYWEEENIKPSDSSTVKGSAATKENASENTKNGITSKKKRSKKNSLEDSSRPEVVMKTIEPSKDKKLNTDHICPHSEMVQCYLSTFNVWEYETMDDEVDYQYLQSQIPPTITTETWESWLTYWMLWRSTYVDLGWVHRYPKYCKEETKEWYKNYLTDKKVMSALGYHDDIELHKEKDVLKHPSKSGEGFETLLDNLYAEHSFIRYWVHFRLYLRDRGLIELNDELAEYLKYYGVTKDPPPPLSDSDSDTGAKDIEPCPLSEDTHCSNKYDTLVSPEVDDLSKDDSDVITSASEGYVSPVTQSEETCKDDETGAKDIELCSLSEDTHTSNKYDTYEVDELSKGDSGVITAASEDYVSLITQSEETCKDDETRKTPAADVPNGLEVHCDIDKDAVVSSDEPITGAEKLKSKLSDTDELESELTDADSMSVSYEDKLSGSLNKFTTKSSCETSVTEQGISHEENNVLTDKVLPDDTKHANSPSISNTENIDSSPTQMKNKNKSRGGSKKKYSPYDKSTSRTIQLFQQKLGMQSSSKTCRTGFIFENANGPVTINLEHEKPTTMENPVSEPTILAENSVSEPTIPAENSVSEPTIPTETSVNEPVTTSESTASELADRIKIQMNKPTITSKPKQRTQTKRKYDEMEDDATPFSIEKLSAQDVPHKTSSSKFQRILSAVSCTFRSIWSIGTLYTKAAMNLILFLLRVNPYAPGHEQFLTFTPYWWFGHSLVSGNSLIEKQMRTAEKKSVDEVWRFFSSALRHITFYPPLTSVDTQYYTEVNRFQEERNLHYNLIKITKNINEESKSYKGLSVRYLTIEEMDYEMEKIDETDSDSSSDEVGNGTETHSDEDGNTEESSDDSQVHGNTQVTNVTGIHSDGENAEEPSGDSQEHAEVADKTEKHSDEDGNTQELENIEEPVKINTRKVKQEVSVKSKIHKLLKYCRTMHFPILEDCKEETPQEIPESVKKYWNQRYRIFLKHDDGIKLDEESWYSVTPEIIAGHQAIRCSCDVVIDGFCGAGGNAIQLASTCNKVIAIDIDPAKIELARYNAKIYGVDNLEFIVGDFFEIAPKMKADVVFLSPPWGGIDYKKEKVYDIFTFGGLFDGKKMFEVAKKITPNIAMYLPKHTSVLQIVELAGCGGQVDIEFDHIGNKRKSLTAYYGKLATKPLSRDTFLI